MKTLDLIVAILLIAGAINWGLVGLFNFNLVATIFSFLPILARIVYIVVGLAGIYEIFKLKDILNPGK